MMEQAVLEQYHYRIAEIQEKNNEGTKMYGMRNYATGKISRYLLCKLPSGQWG